MARKNEYVAKLLAILAEYGKGMDLEGELLVKAIRELLEKGIPVSAAVDTAVKQRKYNAYIAKSITDSVYKMALTAYGIPTTIRVAAADRKAITKALTETPWTGDNMKLSTRLHGTSKAMRESIVSTIQASLNRQEGLEKLSMQLYDGYNSGKNIIPPAQLPTYLEKLHQSARAVAAGDKSAMKEFEKAFGNASANIEKMAARNLAGTPNTDLMTTYKNLLKEADKIVKATGMLNTAALDNAVWLAVQEKARYHADRIARTEDASAWFDSFILENQDDELVWGYRWVLSNRHKYVPFDQCDVCANMDVGYGPGVYPKNKVPSIPRHPHCMCSLEVVYVGEVDELAPFNPDKAREYIDGLTDQEKEALFGLNGAKAYANGEDWQKWLRGWDGFKPSKTRLNAAVMDKIKDKAIATEVESCYNEIVKKEPNITRDIQGIVEASGGTMEGLEYRIKTKESFIRKVDADYQQAVQDDASVTKAFIASKINDAIRYTAVADEDTLYDVYIQIVEQLKLSDYDIVNLKNTWLSTVNPYKGINVIIRSPNGQKFELQFHTPDSFDLKQNKMHELYEEFRLPTTSDARREELRIQMMQLSQRLKTPKHVDKI